MDVLLKTKIHTSTRDIIKKYITLLLAVAFASRSEKKSLTISELGTKIMRAESEVRSLTSRSETAFRNGKTSSAEACLSRAQDKIYKKERYEAELQDLIRSKKTRIM